MKQKYISKFGNAYECSSDNNAALMKVFVGECRRHGVMYDIGQLFGYMSEFPEKEEQLSIFG